MLQAFLFLEEMICQAELVEAGYTKNISPSTSSG